MNRIDRLMGMITLLQSKKHQTLEQLARHFKISERTVFRDLRAMSEIGIPVQFEPEKGYSVAGGFFLPPVSLTEDEANALTLAEPLVVRFADPSVQRHYAAALSKINMVLGRAQREALEKLRAQTTHFIPDQFAHLLPSAEYLTPIQHAIIEKRIVKIEYENAEGECSDREIEPIGLTFYSLNWHLIAWCHLRGEYRDFRVSRIRNLRVTLKPFLQTNHIELNDYLQTAQREMRAGPISLSA